MASKVRDRARRLQLRLVHNRQIIEGGYDGAESPVDILHRALLHERADALAWAREAILDEGLELSPDSREFLDDTVANLRARARRKGR